MSTFLKTASFATACLSRAKPLALSTRWRNTIFELLQNPAADSSSYTGKERLGAPMIHDIIAQSVNMCQHVNGGVSSKDAPVLDMFTFQTAKRKH